MQNAHKLSAELIQDAAVPYETGDAVAPGAALSSPEELEALIDRSLLAVLIVGDATLTDFTLIDAKDFPPALVPGTGRPIGAIGILKTGHQWTVLTEPLDHATVAALSAACARHIVQVLERHAEVPSTFSQTNA